VAGIKQPPVNENPSAKNGTRTTSSPASRISTSHNRANRRPQCYTDVNAAETAAEAAITANVTNDTATTSAQVTQAKVALLIAQGEQQQAIDVVKNMMTKPTKSFKPNGQPPPLDIEAEKETFSICETRWNLYQHNNNNNNNNNNIYL
jgi:hypothetical protein